MLDRRPDRRCVASRRGCLCAALYLQGGADSTLAPVLPPTPAPTGSGIVRTVSDSESLATASAVANPGDAIELTTTSYSSIFDVARSGTVTHPIVIRPAPGANPVVTGASRFNCRFLRRDRSARVHGRLAGAGRVLPRDRPWQPRHEEHVHSSG